MRPCDQSRVVPAAGTGAGTFPFTHYRFRDHGGVVKHAHSQWFNVLSELGVVGLGPVRRRHGAASWPRPSGNPFARRRDPLHPLLVALAGGRDRVLRAHVLGLGLGHGGGRDLVFVFVAVCASYRATRARTGGGKARVGRRYAAPETVRSRRRRRPSQTPRERAEDEPAAMAATSRRPSHTAGATCRGRQASPARPGERSPGREAVADAATRRQPERPPPTERGRPEYERHAGRRAPLPAWDGPRGGQRRAAAARRVAGCRRTSPSAPRTPRWPRRATGRCGAALAHARRAAAARPAGGEPAAHARPRCCSSWGRTAPRSPVCRPRRSCSRRTTRCGIALGELQQGALGQTTRPEPPSPRALALNPRDAASRYELELLAQ